MAITIIKSICFAVISCVLLAVSWKPLRIIGSHGFYRFFAWEAILVLILLNIEVWFFEPFSILQIISWIFLFLSLILLEQGVYLILAVGKPRNERQDAALMKFEKTSNLITTGIYQYIRHPLYGSLLFLAWGAFLKNVTWSSVWVVTVATLCLVATAKADESECIKYFGTSYEEYMLNTKMFVPFIF